MLSSDRSTQAVRDATRTISPEDQDKPGFDQVDLATTLRSVTSTKSASDDPKNHATSKGNGVKVNVKESIGKVDLEEVKHTETERNDHHANATHTTIPTDDRAEEIREEASENGENARGNDNSSGAAHDETKTEAALEKRPKKNVLMSRGVSAPAPRQHLNGAEESNGPTTPQREAEHRAKMKEWEASKLLRFADETGGTLYETMYTNRLHYAASNGNFETIVEEAPEGRRFPCCTIS